MRILLEKIFDYWLVRIIGGVILLVGSVILLESLGRRIFSKIFSSEIAVSGMIAGSEAATAVFVYIIFFRWSERRDITELKAMPGMAAIGFATGLGIQSLVVFILYLSHHYHIEKINPVSSLLPGFMESFIAGVVGELIIRGIIFRILEQQFGTRITLIFMVILFFVLHAGLGMLTGLAAAVQAGLLLSSIYIRFRNLWAPIFLHFAYDFAEPGIFGGINPGIHVQQTLISSSVTGSNLISGGAHGPQSSISAILLCLVVSFAFLYRAKNK